MAGGAEAAKSFLESAFNKSKEVLSSAAESTKGLANVAMENVSKIIPHQNSTATDPNAPGAPAAAPGTAPADAPPS